MNTGRSPEDTLEDAPEASDAATEDTLEIRRVTDDFHSGGKVGWVDVRRATSTRLALEKEGYVVEITGPPPALSEARIRWWRV